MTRGRFARRLASVIVASALVFGISPARADRTSVRDSNDKGGPIDVARLVQGHYFATVLYRVIARNDWESKDLKGGRIVLYFDAAGGPTFERKAIIRHQRGGGLALRSKIVNAHGKRVGKGVLRRPSDQSVEIWIKRRVLGFPKRYRMYAKVTTAGSVETCAGGCTDRVPDRGTVHHRLHQLCLDREPTIAGTRGDDELEGTKRTDVIAGRGGDDEITHVQDSDLVCGGTGDDVIEAGRGFLFLRGGPGADRIALTGPRPQRCDDTSAPASCAYPEAAAFGGMGRDVLIGGRFHEHLLGGGGADVLRGSHWADRLDGGRGRDALRGGRGRDSCRRGEDVRSCNEG